MVTVAWAVRRSEALKELAAAGDDAPPLWLYYWLRFVIPGAIVLVGIWWLLTDLLGVVGGV